MMMKWREISTFLFLFLTTVLPIINGYVIANEHQHLKGFKAIECGDGSSCLADQTCCPDGAGGYGCCPTPDATCCEDHIHCCPLDYPVCDVNTGSCRDSEGINKIAFLKKYESIAESAFS